jgi:hypothetical protein
MIIVEPTMVKLNQICESCFNSYRIGSVDVILQEDLYNPGTIAWKHIGNSSLKGLPCPTWGRPGFSLTLKLLVYYNCFVVWNMKNICFHIWGISSSQLTHIFQRGRSTTKADVNARDQNNMTPLMGCIVGGDLGWLGSVLYHLICYINDLILDMGRFM